MTNTSTTTHQRCPSIQSDLKAFLHGEYQSNVERQGQIKGHLFSCEDCTTALAEIMVAESDRLKETVEVPTKEALPSFEILNVLGVMLKQGAYNWEKLKQFAKQDWAWAKKEMAHLTSNIQETLKAAMFIEETGNLAYAHLGETLAPTQINTMGAQFRDPADQPAGQEISMEILTPPTVTEAGQFLLSLRSDDSTLEGATARCFLNTVEQMQIVFEGALTKELKGSGVELTIEADGLPNVETMVMIPLDQLTLHIVKMNHQQNYKNEFDIANTGSIKPDNPYDSTLDEAITKSRLSALLKELQRAFDKAPKHCLEGTSIKKIIREFIGSPFLDIQGKLVDVLEELIKNRMVSVCQLDPPPQHARGTQEYLVQMRWEFTPSYMVNRLWGIPLEGGLKVHFEGGIILRANEGVSAIMVGETGVGKTMMAIHLATVFASHGYAGVYITGEKDPGKFIEQLSVLGYSPKSPSKDGGKWVFIGNGREFVLEICDFLIDQNKVYPPLRQNDGQPGVLTFMKVNPSFEGLEPQKIVETCKFFCQMVKGKSCLVFDCFNEILENIKEIPPYFFSKLFKLNPMQLGLFTSSLDLSSAIIQQAQQKADMVFHLTREIRGKNVFDRAIQTLKSETQRCNMGKHFFSIDRPEGLVLFPSSRSLKNIWDRRMPFLERQRPESWKLDAYFDLDPILSNDIKRGSSILLRGEGATHRFPIGLSFLGSVIQEEPDAQVILLSLRENHASIIQTIQNYPQLFPLLNQTGDDFNSRVEVGYLPPDRFGPERILDWARKVLAKQLKQNRHVRRVLFSNFTQFRNSPLFEEDEVFVQALVHLFKKNNVTSLYIDTVDENSIAIPGRFDAVLRTFNEEGQGTQIKVEYTTTCNASHWPYHIKRERTNKRGEPDLTQLFHILQLSPKEKQSLGGLPTQMAPHAFKEPKWERLPEDK